MQFPMERKLHVCWQVRFGHLLVFKVPSAANLIYSYMIRKGPVHCNSRIFLPSDGLYGLYEDFPLLSSEEDDASHHSSVQGSLGEFARRKCNNSTL